ncbi:MAG: 50S ribosomal protein L10 [bacterium]|nr:50S ribosomal protein L10 [bacterium]
MANTQKKSIVEKISSMLSQGSPYALIEFDGSSHKALEILRKDLKGVNSTFQVLKNSLFEKAVNQLSQKESKYKKVHDTHFPLVNKTALVTFGSEWIEGLKKYYDSTKGNELFSFKFGFIDEELYDQTGLKKLATLPSKNQILAQLIGAMKNPMARTTRAISSPIQKLVFILSQKSQQSS